MKKYFTLIITFLIIPGTYYAQTVKQNQKHLLPLHSSIQNKFVPLLKHGRESSSNKNTSGHVNERNDNPTVSPQSIIIGTTTFDMQTNSSNCNRIYQKNDTVGAIWTMSNDLSGLFPDRGTGYNFYNGTAWGNVPTTSLDSIAWSNIDLGSNNTEYIVGHNKTSMVDDLILLKRTPAGSGAWSKSALPPHPGGHFCMWPKMRVGGANGNSIHVVALTKPTGSGGTPLNGVDGAMTYSRSQDGGATWNQVHVPLPLVDQAHYSAMDADSYTIDVNGSNVVIAQGSFYNDWVIWKSTDDGTTWTRTVVWPFPIPAYDENTMITDINSDGIADTVEFIDGSLAVLLDNNGLVHCWAGRMRVIQELPGSTALGHFPATDGLYYWNESFLGNPPAIVASTTDIDGDPILYIEPDIPHYEMSLTSMPSAAVDAANNIYVAYSSIKENTSSGGIPGQSYRNVYCKVSPDNGVNWSAPVNMMDSDFDECVFPSLARNINTGLHLIYQQDGEPGMAVWDPDPIGNNDIVHISESPADIFAGVPVYPLDFLEIKGHVYFDSNQNGNEDTGEPGLMGISLQLTPVNYFEETIASGDYTFTVDTGVHTVNLLAGPNWQITSDSTTYTVDLDSVSVDSLDFGLYSPFVIYQVNSSLTPGIPRCNSYINYHVTYQNTGTVTTFGTVKFIKDPQLTFIQSYPPYTSISGDTIEWNFANLFPFEQRLIAINLSSAGLVLGDTIINCEEVNFNGATGGVIPVCSTQAITCSFDPNDKAVSPEGIDIPHYTLLSDTLIYTIRFQNTGNDTAFTVRIRDTLDAFLDPASFHMIAASHPAQVTKKPNGALLFTFNNILLPDSNTNGPASNGFVKYSVRPLAGTPIGTEVNNTAYIFFDYNTGIVTNTTYNTLVDVIGLPEYQQQDLKISVIPNPFSDKTTISFSEPLNDSHSVLISDLSGRIIKKFHSVTGRSLIISSLGMSQGMYFCIVMDETGNVKGVEKLVVK